MIHRPLRGGVGLVVVALLAAGLSACAEGAGRNEEASTSSGGDTPARSATSDATAVPLRADALRTPDAAFDGLDGWGFTPQYVDVDGFRMAYVDEGPSAGDPVLMLHGVPTWGYLYRSMVPVVTEAGHRVVVPDLIGFGRSDKPTRPEQHSYEFHVESVVRFVEDLDLDGITLFCQDWGSLIGLRVVAEIPDRFDRIVVSNGGLPVGGSTDLDQVDGAFTVWRSAVEQMNVRGSMPIEFMMSRQFGDQVGAAYAAPFPDPSYQVGPLTLPLRVPVTPDDPANPAQERAWEVLSSWDEPFLTAFGDSDPITEGAERDFIERVPGAAGQPHTIIEGGSHFIQERHGPELARIITAFIDATPVGR